GIYTSSTDVDVLCLKFERVKSVQANAAGRHKNYSQSLKAGEIRLSALSECSAADHVAIDELAGRATIGREVGIAGPFVVPLPVSMPAAMGIAAGYFCR